MKPLALVCLALAALAGAPALAHKASDSYLSIDTGTRYDFEGRWDIGVIDLERIVGLDANADGRITWGELRTRAEAVMSHALGALTLQAGGRDCALVPGSLLVTSHAGENYASFDFGADCAGASGTLQVEYGLLFATDAGHRGFLRFGRDEHSQTAVLTPQRPAFTSGTGTPMLSGAADFLREGIHHILIGYDHIAFLVLLLLPGVLRRERGAWQPVERLPVALLDMARVVTAFTIAHSVTLTVAALGLVELPSKPVELAIAASVIVAGLHNIFPLRIAPRWGIAFGFGLIHGFGFASVLADLGAGDKLIVELAAFNIGVEIGQLAIACVLVPLVYALRTTRFYRRGVVPVTSLAVAALAGFWFFERALG